MNTFNFADHLLQLNKQRSSKVAFIDDTRSLTYGELDAMMERVAAALLMVAPGRLDQGNRLGKCAALPRQPRDGA